MIEHIKLIKDIDSKENLNTGSTFLKTSYFRLFSFLFFILKGERKTFYTVLLLAFFTYVLNNSSRIIVSLLVDELALLGVKTPQNTINYYVWLTIGAVFFTVSCALSFKTILRRLIIRSSSKLRMMALKKMQSFNLATQQLGGSGAKLQKISSGVVAYGELLVMMVDDLFATFSSIVINLIIFYPYGYKYLVASFLVIMANLGVRVLFSKKLDKVNNQLEIARQNVSNQMVEISNNVLTIEAYRALPEFQAKTIAAEKNFQSLAFLQDKLLNFTAFLSNGLINNLSHGVLLIFMFQDYANKEVSLGQLTLLYASLWPMIWAFNTLFISLEKLDSKKIQLLELYPIFTEVSNKEFGYTRFLKKWQTLRIQNLNFVYQSKNDQELNLHNLKNVSLEIKRGQKIGFIGESGSGKTTLVKILMGLYKPLSGQISFDDLSLDKITSSELANNMTLITQDTEVFNMSFYDNLTMLKEVPLELVLEAIATAQLSEVLESLDLGIDTVLGEKGYKLSGGQRQRLGIARGLIHVSLSLDSKSHLLILDEATSALDTETEAKILKALNAQLLGVTTIAIAHRLSSLKGYDRIISFANGKLIEDGGFDQLLDKKDSIFAKLWCLQK
jgi:ATP-binding cassette, subfamily B, bacterial